MTGATVSHDSLDSPPTFDQPSAPPFLSLSIHVTHDLQHADLSMFEV